jgi:hypothetical protein
MKNDDDEVDDANKERKEKKGPTIFFPFLFLSSSSLKPIRD